MRSKSSLLVLVLAIWWILVNLPWLAVGDQEFTGGQMVPVLNLLPAIAITAVFISLYGKLRKALLMLAILISGLGVYISLGQDLQSSAVVIAELERLSGLMNPESHEAGIPTTELWGKIASVVANAAAVTAGVLSLFGSTSGKSARSQTDNSQDNRSLWDEQN